MRPPSDNGIGILERLEGREIGRAKLGRGAKSKPDLNSLFERYDELAGDVARSKHQFFQSNVQRWLEFLDSTAPFTKPILQQLEGPVDFNIWFQPYKVVGIAGGTKTFEWPQERNERLGLQLLLFRQFATGNVEPGIFALTILSSGRNINDGISDIIDQIFLPMSRELKHYLREVTGPPEVPSEDVSVNAARRNDEIKRYESELAGRDCPDHC